MSQQTLAMAANGNGARRRIRTVPSPNQARCIPSNDGRDRAVDATVRGGQAAVPEGSRWTPDSGSGAQRRLPAKKRRWTAQRWGGSLGSIGDARAFLMLLRKWGLFSVTP